MECVVEKKGLRGRKDAIFKQFSSPKIFQRLQKVKTWDIFPMGRCTWSWVQCYTADEEIGQGFWPSPSKKDATCLSFFDPLWGDILKGTLESHLVLLGATLQPKTSQKVQQRLDNRSRYWIGIEVGSPSDEGNCSGILTPTYFILTKSRKMLFLLAPGQPQIKSNRSSRMKLKEEND